MSRRAGPGKSRFGPGRDHRGRNRLPVIKKKRNIIIKRTSAKEKATVKKPVIPFFSPFIVKSLTRSVEGSHYYVLRDPNKPIYSAVLTLGEKVINSGRLMELANESKLIKSVSQAREAVAEAVGYTLDDLSGIGDVPKVGSSATGKVEIIKRKNRNFILLHAIAFPSLKKFSAQVKADLRRTFCRTLVATLEAQRELQGNSTLEIRVKASDNRLIRFLLEENFKMSKSGISEDLLSFKRKF